MNWDVLRGGAVVVVDGVSELGPKPLTVVEVLKPGPPLTVVELELLVVGIAMAVVVGTDVSTAGIETGWPTPEHKDSTTLDTAIGHS